MVRLRAYYDGKVIVPVGPVDLPVGRVIEIDAHAVHDDSRGAPAAVLRAIGQPPHVSGEDAAALMEAIEGGKLPVRYRGAFDE